MRGYRSEIDDTPAVQAREPTPPPPDLPAADPLPIDCTVTAATILVSLALLGAVFAAAIVLYRR